MPAKEGAQTGTAFAPCTGVRRRDAALMAYARGFEHPAKIRIVHWLARALVGNRVLVRHAPGTVVEIDPSDYVGWAILKTGCYEPASLDLALRIMGQEPGLFVDVGAHFGWYSCAVAAISGTRVVGVEPDCHNGAALRENIARNRLRNVAVVAAAAGPEDGMVRIARHAPGNSGTVAVRPAGEAAASGGEWVMMTPLDRVLRSLVEPPIRPVLVKIDVEGFERAVLTGLDLAGPFRPRNILMEYTFPYATESWDSFGTFEAFFADHGYDLRNVYGAPLHDAQAIPEYNVWARERQP